MPCPYRVSLTTPHRTVQRRQHSKRGVTPRHESHESGNSAAERADVRSGGHDGDGGDDEEVRPNVRSYTGTEMFFPHFLIVFRHSKYMLHILRRHFWVVRSGFGPGRVLDRFRSTDFTQFSLE